MPEDEFWELIAVLEGSSDEDAVGRLTEALRAGGKRKAVAFQERLAATLHELDREVLFQQPVRWADDPDGDVIPLSHDSFLYLRADIVAKGKQVVEQVLANPAALLDRAWDDGEMLLSAADEAVEDEIETRISYETGSNEQHWTSVEFDASSYQRPMVAVLVSDLLDVIEAYEDDALTIPVDPPMYAWPSWFPDSVLDAASGSLDQAVRTNGGIPADLGVEQIQVTVGFGDSWELAPDVAWKVEDDTGMGLVTRVRVAMRQADVRAWKRPQQETALYAAVARAVLAVLPPDHGARPALVEAVAAGRDLLPNNG